MGLMGLFAVGCGAPVPPPPPAPNSPPRIVNSTPGAVRLTFFNSTACPELNPPFSLVVEERDLRDVLFSHWFINGTNTEPFIPMTSGPAGSPMRTLNAPVQTAFKMALANLAVGTHVLTVYVADSEFNAVVDGQVSLIPRPALADGGTDSGDLDSFTWVLDVEPCP